LKCEALIAVSLRLQKGTNLIEDLTETPSGVKGFESTHGLVLLFDSAMVLLQMIVQVAVRPVHHPLPENVPIGARVGITAIGRDAVRRHPSHRPRRPKKGLGRHQITRVAEPRINEVAVALDGTVQVGPLPLNFDIGLIYIPALSHAPVASLAQDLAEERVCIPTPAPFRA
jgi:hypothetical protein